MKNLTKLFFCFSFFLTSCVTIPVLNRSTTSKNFNENFVWGINGHPIWSYDYENAPLEQQINLIKEHQFDYYRIDINTDTLGNIKPSRQERFDQLMILAAENKIKILPTLRVYEHLENVKFNLSPIEAFRLGMSQAQGFVKKYGHHFDYYELGNEIDIKTIKEEKLRGFEISDYKLDELELIANYLKGMVSAIKDNDPNSKILINISGWLRWGFLDYMVEKNVEFDILSYHWYSENGFDLFDINNPQYDIYSTLVNKFRKPIWITEINKYNGSKYYTEHQQAEMMDLYIKNLKDKPFIEGFFVYELYDQPYHETQAWVDYEASVYGIVGWESDPPDYSKYYYKPVSDVLKYRIEEAKSGDEDFIYSVLFDLSKTQLNEEDLRYWNSRLKILKNKELVINEILENDSFEIYPELTIPHIPEEISKFITSVYQTFLKRNPAEKETRYWKRALKKRVSSKDFIVKILLSEEYWENAIWNGYEKRTGYNKPK